jgi:hypothetical protein
MISSVTYGVILLFNIIILVGWFAIGIDPIWNLFQAGSPLKIYTAACFSVFSIGNILLYFSKSQANYKISSACIDWVKYFSLVLIGLVVLKSGVPGTLNLSGPNTQLFNFPAVPTLINFILIAYGCRTNERWNDSARFDANAAVFINTAIALVGFALGRPYLYYSNPESGIVGMALFTALFFFVMSVINLAGIRSTKKRLDTLLA